MPDFRQFALPDLGEGLTEGEIISWLVRPGDTVRLNQPIVEVETAKAAVEVPSPYAGLVTELHHDEGETVDVGSPLLTFDVDPDGPTGPDPGEPAAAAGDQTGLTGDPAPGGRTSVLVGYGPRDASARRRPRRAPPGPDSPPPAPDSPPSAAPPGSGHVVLAKPPVRKLARELGVDLATVRGSGPDGTITRADVEGASRPRVPPPGLPVAGRPANRGEERIPVRGVRRATAQAMVASAFTAPHVTEFLTVDVTATMDLVGRIKAMQEFAGLRVSPLLLVAKALLTAVRRHPQINATWDEGAGEIVVKHYVNLGIAAATPRGLIVPNIKDADLLSLLELAQALAALTDAARAGTTTPADLQHGTITITNVGVFGVDTGTPILNPGEAAILAFGAVRPMPWVHHGAVAVRQVTQLALSFDHRLVDGQLGSEVLAEVGALLSDPDRFVAWS